MPFINVGVENTSAIDIHYEDIGSGQPIVLVHGYPLSSRSWERQIPPLLRAGFRVITYDRRGFGGSSQPTIGYDYDTLAQDLHKLMTRLDLRDAVLAGFSMGGGEVARYTATYGSHRVRAVVLLSAITPFLLKSPQTPNGLQQSTFDGIQHAIAKDRLAFLTGFINDLYNADLLLDRRVSAEVLRDSWNVAAAASPIATWACPQAWRTDFRTDLRRIDVPTLVIHGTADRILPVEATGELTHTFVPNSRYIQIEGAPHGCMWTHADEVNRALLEFVGAAALV
jgi:non-heme chloroperoxidase